MAIFKPTSESTNCPKQDTGRRSFIRKAGVAASAALASAAAGIAGTGRDRHPAKTDEARQLANRIGILEDAEAVRGLCRQHAGYLDRGRYEEAVGLFADDGAAVYNGGLYAGREQGVRRLYCGAFGRGRTGKSMEPAPGFGFDPADHPETVEVASDRTTAVCRFPYSMRAGAPMVSDSSLVALARLQGEGIRQWWEGGIQEVSCVKTGGAWKIGRVEYRLLARADYRPGRTSAEAIDVPPCARTFPADPSGPDTLV